MRTRLYPSSRAPRLVLLNKPYRVLCQFTDRAGRPTLGSYLPMQGIYPAGRLDYESEGLVVLTDSGQLQHLISDPKSKRPKTYWVQVEGRPTQEQLGLLLRGIRLAGGKAMASGAILIAEPPVWPRDPPVRKRRLIPTSWLQITLREGRKHMVRHLTAAVGCPTLRLIRYSVGPWTIGGLQPGEWREILLPAQRELWLDRPAPSDLAQATPLVPKASDADMMGRRG